MRHLLIIPLFLSSLVYGQNFREVSDEKGLTYQYSGVDYQEVGAGLTVLDINNDGWEDLFQAGGIFPSKLWLNDGGVFRDATEDLGLGQIEHLIIQAAKAGDFNNDGYEDLFLCNLGYLMNTRGDGNPPILLQNIEGKGFRPVFQEAFQQVASFPDATWGDVNKDGFIDLYVLGYLTSMHHTYDTNGNILAYDPQCIGNLFYLNLEGTGFEESSDRYGIQDLGCGLAGSFTDFDDDHDMDLMVLNDFGAWSGIGNRLFRNDYPEPKFTDVSVVTNFYNEMYGMGLGIGDYDHDGRFDYYVTNIGNNSFLRNNATHTFEEISIGLNLHAQEGDHLKNTSWSGVFFDADNDGDVDLYVSKGYLHSLEDVVVLDRNQLFVNQGDGTFIDQSSASNTNDSLSSRGIAVFDYDRDGDLDIAVAAIKMGKSEFGGLDQKIKLFENVTANDNKWIKFSLVGNEHVNSSCIGCSVKLSSEGIIQLREVDGGSGHSSQSSRVLHFGLGSSEYAEDIEIQWLGADSTYIKKLKSNQHYLLKPNGEIQLYN